MDLCLIFFQNETKKETFKILNYGSKFFLKNLKSCSSGLLNFNEKQQE